MVVEHDLKGQRVLLGVSGSIAAYKAADIASRLTQRGADVHCVLTAAAARFIGPDALRAITLNPVVTDLFDEPLERNIAHIELAQRANITVVAPASANVIAKMALGIADDLLTTCLLATTAPLLVAPAMNSVMLQHPATRQNLEILRGRGVRIVESATGLLACRTEGPGRLADVDDIVGMISAMLLPVQDYAGKRVLVTAGPTREHLDPVRYLTNRSSGRMGFAIATAAAARGARVVVVAGHTTAPEPIGCRIDRVETADDMLAACMKELRECDIVVAAAAPADYKTASPSPGKLTKTGTGLDLHLVETVDIVKSLRDESCDQIFVGFAAETEHLVAHAANKAAAKRLDLVVANDVSRADAGFEVETNQVTLVWPDGTSRELPLMTKLEVAHHILDAVLELGVTAK